MKQNGSAEFKDVTAHYNAGKGREEQGIDIAKTNRRREIQFKASHVLLLGFFSWILYVSAKTKLCL